MTWVFNQCLSMFTSCGTCKTYHNWKILKHYKNPYNVGILDPNDVNVGTALMTSSICGDVIKLGIKVDKNGKIIDARFKTFGCNAAIAASSFITEFIKNKTIIDALSIQTTYISKELNFSPFKSHCSILVKNAITNALANYHYKQKNFNILSYDN